MENPKKIELSIEIILKNKRGLELVISPFSDYQMCSEVFFSDQARGYFWWLIIHSSFCYSKTYNC